MPVVITVVRWVGLPIVFAAVVGGCIMLSSWAVSFADGSCDSMVGGSCVEGWHSNVVEWSVYLGIVAALLAVTMLLAKIAPSFKRTTATIAGILGNAPVWFGYFVTGWDDLLLPVILATLSASFGIMVVWQWRDVESVQEESRA